MTRPTDAPDSRRTVNSTSAAGPHGEVVGAEEAWRLLLGVRSGAQAEAAGLLPGSDGVRRWGPRASPEAALLADRYLPLCLAGPRLVCAQLGQSLDGFIATRTGDADYVTGEEDRRHLHRLRALTDAVVVGAGTVVADDPRLTVRACAGAHPVRVVLDPHGRVPPSRGVFTDGAAPTLWVVGAEYARGRSAPHGVELLVLPDREAFAPRRLVESLAGRGLGRLLVEGGGVTVSRFLRDRSLHRLYVTVAPVLLGDGVPGLRFTGPTAMRDALRPPVRRTALGADTLFELDLGTPQPGRPPSGQDDRPGQARDQGEEPVHHGHGQPLGRA